MKKMAFSLSAVQSVSGYPLSICQSLFLCFGTYTQAILLGMGLQHKTVEKLEVYISCDIEPITFSYTSHLITSKQHNVHLRMHFAQLPVKMQPNTLEMSNDRD